jgi:hypothetical protein
VEITTEDGKPVKEIKYGIVKEGVFELDLTGQPPARYYINVNVGGQKVSKRIRVIEPEKK